MAAPLVRDGALIGWISVHYTKGPREWTDEKVATVEASCREFHWVLDDLEASGALRFQT